LFFRSAPFFTYLFSGRHHSLLIFSFGSCFSSFRVCLHYCIDLYYFVSTYSCISTFILSFVILQFCVILLIFSILSNRFVSIYLPFVSICICISLFIFSWVIVLLYQRSYMLCLFTPVSPYLFSC
jgi:hypothetical protein